MMDSRFAYPSDCGGRGSCGKCKIQLVKGELEITLQDRKVLDEDSLKKGYRLSCQAYPNTDCTVRLLSDTEQEMEVLAHNNRSDMDHSMQETYAYEQDSLEYGIAIDLGTTTLAAGLINRRNGEILNMYTSINPQRAFGADIISRIKASNEGNRDKLQEAILNKLQEGIYYLLQENHIDVNHLTMITIAGNTTMVHLLLGYSCKTLGVYPFTPVDCSTILITLKDILQGQVRNQPYPWNSQQMAHLQKVPVVILPGISAFVGGDISAGLTYCGFDKSTEPCLFLDLGTNGEMAIGNKNKIMVTSTAAGPAFEGGNISCGVGSIPGAISHVNFVEDRIQLKTIGDKPPIGICGTGLVDLAAELLKAGIVDGTGLLIDKFFEIGFPIQEGNNFVLTQKDIRELQLAKAAIRAGIEILISHYGTKIQQLHKVYLAGGFGYKMDIEKAAIIGLLPEELKDRIITVGNSSLAGAIQYLTDRAAQEAIDQIISVAEEIHLSNQEEFNELYIKYMSFYNLEE
jgi:uncharacterized 2Fe-2S/4Fe-4S cluster protein (DUF4445 family)